MSKGPIQSRPFAAVGFTVKSGWGSAVLLVGPVASPSVVDSHRVELSDPAVPESRQPYHESFGTARPEGTARSGLIASVERFSSQSLAALFERYSAGYDLARVGLIVGSLIEPERLGNTHFRIHAHEGKLFRRVVEEAVVASGLRCVIWRERDLHAAAAEVPGLPGGMRKMVDDFGKAVSGPWRAEQKAAALAAWLVLAGADASASRKPSAHS